MNYAELMNGFDPEAPAPIYLFCPYRAPRARAATFEPILAERAVEHMTKALVDPSMRDMAYSAYYADETDPAEIVSNAETLPFLAERRVILVRNAERYGSESGAGAMLPYLDNPCESTVLLLVANKVDKRSKLYKACDKHGVIVECGELNEKDLRLWIHDQLKERNKEIAPEAVRELLVRAGTKLGDVQNAVTVAANYIGERETIEADDIIAACSDVHEEQVWALTDAIAESNTREAMRVLRALYDLGKSEFEILGTINWLLKTAYTVATAESGDPFLRSFPAKKCGPLAKKFGVAKLKDAFHLLVEADFMLRSTGVDRSLAVELLVIKLSWPRKRAA